jgi:hypothetical protein
MSRDRRTAVPSEQYVTVPRGDYTEVVDRLSGYTLSTHGAGYLAEKAAAFLNAHPEAAAAAHDALAQAQTGPAADARRALLRWGYRWTMDAETAAEVFVLGRSRVEELVVTGDLVRVWSTRGAAYVTTPERFKELDIKDLVDGDKTFPSAQRDQLARPQTRLWALPPTVRYAACECGRTRGNCLSCAPFEEFECDWSGCRANAVTVAGGRPLCARDFWSSEHIVRNAARR